MNEEIKPSRHHFHQYVPLNVDPFTGRPLNWNVHPAGIPTEQLGLPIIIEDWQKTGASLYSIVRSEIFNIPEDIDKYTKTLEWVMNLKIHQSGDIYKELIQERKSADGKIQGWTIWFTWYELRGYIPTQI